MRRTAVFAALLSLNLASCREPATTAPPPEPTRLDTATPAPTETSPPPTALPTAAPIAFYRLRVDFTTTSDWTVLVLRPSETFLTTRLVETRGDPSTAQPGIPETDLFQSLDNANAGRRIGLTADFALDAAGPAASLNLLIEKGHIGTSVARLSVLAGNEEIPLGEFVHQGVVPNPDERNARAFEIDLAPLAVLAPEVSGAGEARFPRLLWAFYYPWYTRQDWSSPWLRDVPAEPYASADRTTMERHVRQAKEAGIDGFISSWWGPHDRTDDNLRTLLKIAQEEDFLVTIYFETLASEGGLPRDEIVRWLTYLLKTYGDHPAFARLDGKPVVVFWATDPVPLDTWGEAFETVREEGLDFFALGMSYSPSYLDVFDGLHQYGIFNIPNLEQVLTTAGNAVRHYGLLNDSPPKLWAATVQPGYDDRLLPDRRGGQVQARANGDVYRRTWNAALASDPDWILVTTWNEWWEHTHIEPSQEFGGLYLEITREYADAWRGN